MFAVGALMLSNYTMMANNMAFRGMMLNNARLNLISNAGTQDLTTLSALDTQLEIDALNCGLQYRYAMKMIEQLKELQKEDIKRSFDIFA